MVIYMHITPEHSMPIHVLQFVIHVQKLLCMHKIPTAYEQKHIQRNPGKEIMHAEIKIPVRAAFQNV